MCERILKGGQQINGEMKCIFIISLHTSHTSLDASEANIIFYLFTLPGYYQNLTPISCYFH